MYHQHTTDSHAVEHPTDYLLQRPRAYGQPPLYHHGRNLLVKQTRSSENIFRFKSNIDTELYVVNS